ncbi:hypothetical protein DVH24_002358 [Malus domestica]|uniref:Uncharacterized protein n=1 Tax=Malus domestica TaxID=3750 RepID=A0A498I6H1_MALDO|nr:hypothetical protein DVH24_002358 [Malus domestica]
MSNRKEANFGFQEFVVWFQFIPNKKGSTNSVIEISKTFEISEQILLSLAHFLSFSSELRITNRILIGVCYQIWIRQLHRLCVAAVGKFFYKHHTSLKIQRLKYTIKYSKSNWSKSIAMGKLTKLKINHENLKHQVQANGWQAWRKDENKYGDFTHVSEHQGKNATHTTIKKM